MHTFTKLLPKTLCWFPWPPDFSPSNLVSAQLQLNPSTAEIWSCHYLMLSPPPVALLCLQEPSTYSLDDGHEDVPHWAPAKGSTVGWEPRMHNPSGRSHWASQALLPTDDSAWWKYGHRPTAGSIWHCFLAAGLPNGLAETPWELITV